MKDFETVKAEAIIAGAVFVVLIIWFAIIYLFIL